MLNVQKFLRENGTLEQLSNDLGIRITRHPEFPLVILNYDQIDSPKTNSIVKECRGLTLETDNYSVIARSFPRFFNWGEVSDEMPLFNWDNCFAQEKCDGSLMILYYYNGWKVNTRGSFADKPCGFSGKTWSELFFEVLPLEKINRVCIPGESYVFEFCSLHNKVIRKYSTPTLYLLSGYLNRDHSEFPKEFSDDLAKELHVKRPEIFNFHSIEEVINYLNIYCVNDQTFEGIVVCDDKGHRWKIKSPLYLGLHKMRGEGDNLFNPKNLVPYILAGELSELICYFPEVENIVTKMKVEVDNAYIHVLELWDEVKDINNQKEFALAVVPKTKFSSLFFKCRKDNLHPKDVWRNSDELILKVLYNK